MEKYIALLRGINVGGNNKIAMPELRKAFENFGFTEVKTYINSGNIIFSAETQAKNKLMTTCQKIIFESFQLDITVAIISATELKELIKMAPEWWTIDKELVNYAIFVIPPATTAEIFTAVGAINPEYEQIAQQEPVIFWSTPREGFNKSRWSKISSSSANNKVTIRNARTIMKLVELSQN